MPIAPRVGIVIVSYNTRGALERCLDAVVHSSSSLATTVIVVDNASTDGSVRLASAYESVTVISNPENVGFARASNQGIRAALADGVDAVLLLNSDAFLAQDSLWQLVSFMLATPDAGICGPQLVFESGAWQRSYGRTPSPWSALLDAVGVTSLGRLAAAGLWAIRPSLVRPRAVAYVDGACMLLRRSLLDEIGLLDEHFFFYLEDVDLCLRARERGWKVYYVPQSRVVHLRGESSARRDVVLAARLKAQGLARFLRTRYGARAQRCYFRVAQTSFRARYHAARALAALRLVPCGRELVYKAHADAFSLHSPSAAAEGTESAPQEAAFRRQRTGSDCQPPRGRPTSTPAALALMLLVLTAIGQTFDNVAIVRISGLSITLPFCLFAAAALFTILSSRSRARPALVLIWLLLAAWQLVVPLALGVAGDRDWLRSEALFVYCACCFLATSSIRVSETHLAQVSRLVAAAIVTLGLLGVLQFALLNGAHVRAVVPKSLAASAWDPAIDVVRTGGLQRAAALAREPSTYALGLSVAMAIYLSLNAMQRQKARRVDIAVIAVGLAGNLASLSVTGLVVAAGSLGAAFLAAGRQSRYARKGRLLLVVGFAAAIVLGVTIVPPLSNRVRGILAGNDRSANVRVTAAVRMLLWCSENPADNLLGSGLGRDAAYSDLVTRMYTSFGYPQTNIVNIMTYIRLSQGWVGMGLHALLALAMLAPWRPRQWRALASLFAALLLYHFGTGTYLAPPYWALLSLVAVLRRALPATEARPLDGGADAYTQVPLS